MPIAAHALLHERALARVGKTVQQKYRITRLLGIGGMAAVYAAVHRNGHGVAIKFLLDRHSPDSVAYRLFLREAYVANRVGHAGAVPVLDDDVDEDGCAFLIMPLLQGETLGARWERAGRRLAMLDVVVCMLDVLDVLASAHANGIVHRDIKPDNLFLTTKGEVCVLDFGIARQIDAGTATMTGIVGTPAFMPPEQALGDRDAIGPHSDCWAVGASIFALLSGEYVHVTAHSGAQLVAAATRPARPLAEVAQDVPPALAHVVDKALAFARADRWGTAQEMRDALVKALEDVTGESVARVTARVRAELAVQLTPDAVEQESTRAPHRDIPDAGTLQPMRLATPHPARDVRWALWLAGTTLLVIGLLIWGVPRLARSPKESLETSARDDKSAADVTTDYLGSTDPNAFAHLQSGLQNLRDASPEAAKKSFGRALELDANLAAAHLYAMMPPATLYPVEINAAERSHYHAALAQRAQLSVRDRAIFEAMDPLMATPPDLAKAETQLEAVSARFPSDWLVLSALGYVQLARGAVAPSIGTFDELLAQDSSIALGWDGRADGLGKQGDSRRKRDSLDECLRRTPHSERCLTASITDAFDHGKCSEAEHDVRTLLALPDGPRGFASYQLANAIWGRGGSMESVHGALVQAAQAYPEPVRRESMLANGESRIAVMTGDFPEVQRALDTWKKANRVTKADLQLLLPTVHEVNMAMELGNRELAGRIAGGYLANQAAWLKKNSYLDGESTMLAFQYRAGALSRAEFEKQRNVWLEHTAADGQLPMNRRWVDAYAHAVSTPEEAVIALGELPRYQPIITLGESDPEDDDATGHVYLLAGDVENALLYLRRAITSCWGWGYPYAHVQAHLHLGQALERKGDVSGACAAYSVVLKHWGKEPRSVSAKAARERSRALRCPSALP